MMESWKTKMNAYVVAIQDDADSDTFFFKRKADAEAFAQGAVLDYKSRGYVEDEMTKDVDELWWLNKDEDQVVISLDLKEIK